MGIIYTLPNLRLDLIDQRNSTTIVIADNSTYASIPTSYVLQITPPGYPTIVPTFTPGSVNVYTCAELGVTCSDDACAELPDGIWALDYIVQPPVNSDPPTTLSVKFIKIDQIKCKYEKAFLSVDLECGCHSPMWKQYMDELRYVKVYIDGSVAECNKSNYKLSYNYYHKADIMLDKLKCKFPASKWKAVGCGCG